MRSHKGLWAILLTSVVLLLGGVTLFKVASTPVGRCYLVRWSGLEPIASNLYVDPEMPEAQRQRLLANLADAEARVTTLYGAYTAEPTIIAGHSMDVMETCGGNSYNRAGRTYLTLVATFIVLGPEGVLSEDVLSHELAHAELSTRVGYLNRNKIPNWFDEGLAVQFDDRYSEAEWLTMTDNGRTVPDLGQMGIIKHNDWLGYATAKHEVRRWLAAVGQDGFHALLQAIRRGEEFQTTYAAIERAQSVTQ